MVEDDKNLGDSSGNYAPLSEEDIYNWSIINWPSDDPWEVAGKKAPVVEDETLIASSEKGPLFTDQTVARISQILDAPIARRYETERGSWVNWGLESRSSKLRLTLTQIKPTTPYTVMGDAIVHITGEHGFLLGEMRGISEIETDDSEEPDIIRFIQEDSRQWALMLITRDGRLDYRSLMKYSDRFNTKA